MKLAGLDIGTTGCKLTVFEESGEMLDYAYRDYPAKRGVTAHEIHAEAIIEGVFAVMKEIAKKHPDIAGIGVTSFGETFVYTDERGKPLHTAMLYTDLRGREECQELIGKLGSKKIAAITGLRPHEMYSISKLMWMKKHCPEIYEKASHIFLMEDFVVYHLTGTIQMQYSLATRTMAFDISKLCWSEEIFEAAGIDVNLMSPLVPLGTSAGTVLPQVADSTGISKDTQIITACHDQVAAAVGSGVFDSKKAVDGAGTVECMIPIHDSIPDVDTMYESYFNLVPYIIPGKYVTYAFSYTGGALIQWCVENLAKKEKELAKEMGISVYDYLEGEYEGPTGMLVLPHFAGAATPHMDINAKGVIVGLTTATTVRDIYHACMEGVGYEMMLNQEHLQKSGVCFEMMHATGGGAKSPVWMQMKADMLNVPVAALATSDAGTVGCAMIAGIVLGCYKNLDDAASYMTEVKKIYYPNQEMHEKYAEYYKKYRVLYEAVRPYM